jgi:hypothetical protein
MTRAMSSRELVSGAARAAAVLFFIALMVAVSGCTTVKYTETPVPTAENPTPAPTRELVVRDLRLTGSAIDLKAVVAGVGTLSVNRQQGSAEGIVTSAIDAATGGVLGEVLP